MILGIDLGTTNSLAGIWRNGEAVLVPNALGIYLTPSAVGLDDNGEALVGQAALERLLTHPHLTAAVFKRYMGTDRGTLLGKRQYRPEELSSLVLRSLKRDAEQFLGEEMREAVISVPAYFNNKQRKATQIAGELAGLKVERLINEPTAAALAYGLHRSEPESRFLVLDLGGGTFDVTILELFEGVMEVRSSAGDNFLGGEDFVDVLVERLVARAAETGHFSAKDISADARLHQAVRREAELAKRRLSQTSTTVMSIRWSDRQTELPITDTDLRTWSEPLLKRIRQPIERALRDANILPSDLGEILLVGGATRMPIIRTLTAQLFGRFPSMEIHPDETVALGAAVQAGLKQRDEALKEVVLTDVCPYSLGIDVALGFSNNIFEGGHFFPILERNTVVPASRVQSFTTLHDRQTKVEIGIYQGESRLVKDNIFLGKIVVGVPPAPKGQEQITVRFTYDINGLLEVEATAESTGVKKFIVIQETPGALSEEQIRQSLTRLAALKIHPFDQTENRTLIARADRLYQQCIRTEREMVGLETAKFQETLKGQDPRTIERARKEFTEFLDSIDSGSPFGPPSGFPS
jgi:molecular chaperone HscC